MASNSDIQVGVSFDMDSVKSGLNKVNSAIKSATGAIANVGSAALNGVKNLTVGIGAAATASAAAVAKIGKESIAAYADYEQLTGGVETLFKDSADIVKGYAKDAYETAGMSANEYMETVTSFSASLISSLGGDTEAAAKQADVAITDMSDNANKMGTSLESLQYAYAGFAKQNYTMLDNLKLGYGGTEEEMQRLLQDAEAISGVHYDISNFNDVVSAIHVIQEEMGIAGTTAREANETIEGSARAMKSAWQNLLVGFADPEQDVGELFGKLIDRVNIYLDNLLPRIEEFIKAFITNLPTMIAGLQEVGKRIVDTIISSLAQNGGSFADVLLGILKNAISNMARMITTLAPIVAEAIQNFIAYIIEFVQSQDFANIIETVKTTAMNIFTKAFELIVEYVPQLAQMAFNMLNTVITNATEMLRGSDFSNVVNTILDVIKSIVGFLMENLPELFGNFLNFIVELVSTTLRSLDLASIIASIGDIIGMIIDALPDFFDGILNAIFTLLDTIIDMIINTDWGAVFEQLITTLGTLFLKLGEALLEMAGNALGRLWEFITTTDWLALGKSIVDGIINGLAGFGDAIVDTITHGITGGVDGFIKFFEIGSPSKLMYRLGGYITQGLINGLESKERGLVAATDGISKILSDGMMLDTSLSASSLMAASYSGSNITNNNITQTYTVGSMDVTNNKTATAAIDELCNAIQIYSNQKPVLA